ncbi:uncharacterized protein LOC136036817 [Artemia franciscana]|uniref:uncharacterized protein LOC136036817 n=1 Tax=Artemia franciscana TaxID=6661 RepID=UPI0032DB7D4C
MVSLIRNMFEQFRSQVQTVEGTTEEFQTSVGILQGCILSPHMFNLFLHCVMSYVEVTNGAMIREIVINELVYAYDIDMLTRSVAELQTEADNLEVGSGTFGMKINENITKYMRVSRLNNRSLPKIKLNGAEIEWIDSFIYLGSQITKDNNHSVDIKRRLALGSTSFKALTPIWKQNRISVKLKLKLFSSIIILIAKYDCEIRTVRIDKSRQLAAFETKLLRRIAGIT